MRADRRRGRARRLADMALAALLLGLVALVAARWLDEDALTLAGTAEISDGDSLRIGGRRIRLQGIDAPELGQICAQAGADYACGRLARQALADLVAGRQVSCEGAAHDRYGRLLARCMAGETQLNRAMVAAGWAISYGDYRAEERQARAARAGLWAGTFDEPQQWRRRHGGLVEDFHGLAARLLGLLRGLFGVR